MPKTTKKTVVIPLTYSQKPGEAMLKRLNEAAHLLYIHEVITEAESEKVKKRLRKKGWVPYHERKAQ